MIIFPAKKHKRSARTAQKERYMKFDCIASTNTGIDFGVKAGNKKIVFIKAGLGGNLFGYDDKYLKIAHRLNERYGCSIISASNPHDGKLHVASDKAIIEAYVKENGIESPELYFFGHSNGGIKGLQLATELTFRKMLLVNMPLMIDFHKTKKYLSIIPDTKITFVYGELTPLTPIYRSLRASLTTWIYLSFPAPTTILQGSPIVSFPFPTALWNNRTPKTLRTLRKAGWH